MNAMYAITWTQQKKAKQRCGFSQRLASWNSYFPEQLHHTVGPTWSKGLAFCTLCQSVSSLWQPQELGIRGHMIFEQGSSQSSKANALYKGQLWGPTTPTIWLKAHWPKEGAPTAHTVIHPLLQVFLHGDATSSPLVNESYIWAQSQF